MRKAREWYAADSVICHFRFEYFTVPVPPLFVPWFSAPSQPTVARAGVVKG
jgi:hypothetical protein